jgi:hypothetical protein
VQNASAVVAAFGQFNLYDADLRAVRLTLSDEGVPILETDLYLPGEFALDGNGVAETEYRITLRCAHVVGVMLADFGGQNVVADYAFEPLGAGAPDGALVRVWIHGMPGRDVDLRCRAVSAEVAGPSTRAGAA